MNPKRTVRYLKITTLNSYEYFSTDSGGNNRNWVKRYTDMLNYYEILCKMSKTQISKDYIEGFKACLDIFHERDNILKSPKEYRKKQ